MADYNSSLPVRTQNPGDVVAKIGDGTTPTQQLAIDSTGRVTVKLDDGTGNAITSTTVSTHQALDVNVVQTTGGGGTVTANQGTPNTLANAWPIEITDGTHGPATVTAASALKVDGSAVTQPVSGTVAVSSISGTVAVTQSTSPWVTSDLADGSVTPGTIATKSMLIGGEYLSTLPTFTTGQQGAIQLDSSGRILVGSIASPLPAGTNTIGAVTQASGPWTQNITQILGAAPSATNPLFVELTNGTAAISPTNPVPVYLQDGGTSINSYNDSASVAAGASANNYYTVSTGKTLHLEQVTASASGKIKLQVQVETGVATNVFNTVFTGFNSTANPMIQITLAAFIDVAAGVRVNALVSNNDQAAMDIYTTVSGHEQ